MNSVSLDFSKYFIKIYIKHHSLQRNEQKKCQWYHIRSHLISSLQEELL